MFVQQRDHRCKKQTLPQGFLREDHLVMLPNTHLRVGAHCLHFSKTTCLRKILADTSLFVIGDLQKNAAFCIIFRYFAGIFSPTSHGTSHENSHKTSHEPIWVYLALCIFVAFVRFPGALYPIAKQLHSKNTLYFTRNTLCPNYIAVLQKYIAISYN